LIWSFPKMGVPPNNFFQYKPSIWRCPHLWLLVEVAAWKASQDYSMCLSHPRITATFYAECPFTTFILKPVSILPSPRIGFLIIVRLSFGISFGAMAKKHKVHVLTY
jgi:hypothetical protein